MKPLDTAPPLVLVQWEDATLLDLEPWAVNKDHTYSPKLFTSVGFLLYEGKQGPAPVLRARHPLAAGIAM